MTNEPLVGFSWTRIIRDYADKKPVELTGEESGRLASLLQTLAVLPWNAETATCYNECRELHCKSIGNESMDTISALIQKVLGKNYYELYVPFAQLVPKEVAGDQYGTWERPSITTNSTMHLFAYYMDVILKHYDKIHLLKEYDVEQIAKYAHYHVLPPADIMMAQAGYDHRGIDAHKAQEMFEELLHAIFKQDGIERVILKDKRVCLLKTRHVTPDNAWKLFATLEAELEAGLTNVILTDEVIERIYGESRIIYTFSKSKNILFGGTPSELYVAAAPFRKMKPYECLQKFGINAMEEAIEKTYIKIDQHEKGENRGGDQKN